MLFKLSNFLFLLLVLPLLLAGVVGFFKKRLSRNPSRHTAWRVFPVMKFPQPIRVLGL
jgi:hypothetical protein